MKIIIALLLLLFCQSALAVKVYKDKLPGGGDVVLQLFDEPCTNDKIVPILKARIKPEIVVKFQRARLRYGVADWDSCWFRYVDDARGFDHVLSIDEAGDDLEPIPWKLFKENSI